MKIRSSRQYAPGALPTRAWSLTLPSWATTPTRPKRATPGASPSGAGRFLPRGAAPVRRTCARCGAIEDGARAAARHIAECHPA